MNKESFITRLSAEPIDEYFIQCQEILYKIEGWFSPASHALFSFILNYQNKNEIIGNLGEIGVWKGKSATVICKFSKEDEKIFLIDPLIKKFSETIYKNIDDVCKCIPKELLFCNLISDNFVKLPNYQTLIKSFRFFHIDGCHTGKNIFKDIYKPLLLFVDMNY